MESVVARADVRRAGGGPSLPTLPLLQVLRGLAALSVAFLHVTQQAGAFVGRPGEPAFAWLRPLPWDAGLDVFFVISGFVILWSSFSLFGQRGAVRRFAVRRIARVVPLYWVATLLFLAAAMVTPASVTEGRPSAGLIVTSFLFLPWPRPNGFVQPVLSLGWTLNYEMLFYALFAACVWLPARAGVASIVAGVVVLTGLGWALQPSAAMLRFWTDPIVLEFGAGVMLAVAALRVRLPDTVRAGLALAAIVAWAALDGVSGIPRVVAYGVPALALVAAAVLARPSPARSPAMRGLVLIGDASYALYLFHPFPMRAFALVFARAGGGAPSVLAYVAVTMVAAIALGVAVHLWVERPLTQWARRLLGS